MSDRRFIILVFILSFLGPFASDSYLPSLPAMGDAYNASPTQTQLTLTLYFLGFSFPQLIYGPLADRFGRRHALITGYIIALLGSILCTVAPTISWLWVGRFLQGAGVAANGALFRTVLRDKFQGPRLSQMGSYLGLLFALFPAIAPFVGGLVQQLFGWEANFYLFIILNIFVILIAYLFLPETATELNHRALHVKEFSRNYMTLLRHKPFLGYSLATACAFSGLIAYYTLSPYIIQVELGYNPFQYGMTAIAVTFGLLLGHFTNARFVMKKGIDYMIRIGFALMLVGGLSLLFFQSTLPLNLVTLLLPTILFLMGSGLVFGNSTAGAFHPFPRIAGSAGALFGTLQVGGTALTSFIVAMLPNSPHTLGYTFSALAIIAFLGYYFLILEKKTKL